MNEVPEPLPQHHPLAPDTDLLVIGGGPAGLIGAAVAARAGRSVTVLEREAVDRPRTGADLLDAAQVAALQARGFDLGAGHPIRAVRVHGRTRRATRAWPAGGSGLAFASAGVVTGLAAAARRAGASIREGTEAVAPLVTRGLAHGAVIRPARSSADALRARYLLIADGADSRFGRALGIRRDRRRPTAVTARGLWASPGHDSATMAVHIGLRGPEDAVHWGTAWVLPLGDGRVGIGVVVMSTGGGFRTVDPLVLLGRLVEDLAAEWGLAPEHALVGPTSGRLPLGVSVGPASGPAHLLAGDALGSADPLSGLGLSGALRSGALAGELLARAIDLQDPGVLQEYLPALAHLRRPWTGPAHRVLGTPWGLRVAGGLGPQVAMDRMLGLLLPTPPDGRV